MKVKLLYGFQVCVMKQSNGERFKKKKKKKDGEEIPPQGIVVCDGKQYERFQ